MLKAGMDPHSKGPIGVIEFLDNGLVPLRTPFTPKPKAAVAPTAAPSVGGVDALEAQLKKTSL